jgi:YidC/Oxa1 family membrane protein insertase
VGFLGTLGSLIMTPLYYAISFVLVLWHKFFTALGLPEDSGAAWALSIIGLTVVIRAALIPLFVRQIKASRNMQLIQPKVKELQKKYGHDRERLAQETMKLYKDSGTNPFASCLPILLQMPIFFALFRLLNGAANGQQHGVLTQQLADDFGSAELFGSVPLSGTFMNADGNVALQVTAAFLVLAMTATTFLTQRQLMSKNMPADALTGPYAQQQKLLLYVLPIVFAVGGIAFPIGVLLYWTTSNLWTMGQQFYVIRNNPAPGTPAFAAKEARDRARAARHGHTETPVVEAPGTTEPPAAPRPAPRQQPKKQSRSQRKKGGGGQQRPASRPTNPTDPIEGENA